MNEIKEKGYFSRKKTALQNMQPKVAMVSNGIAPMFYIM